MMQQPSCRRDDPYHRRMTTVRLASTLALLAALPAAAQNSISIYGGWRGGGAFEQSPPGGGVTTSADLASGGAMAASIDWALDPARNLQLFASAQRSKLPLTSTPPGGELPLTVGYLHFGGSNYFDGRAGQGGYLAGGLGLTWMSPQASGWQNELRPSMSLAIGYEQLLAPGFALRAELRGYATLIHSSGGFFCSGGCTVVIRGDSMFQADALLGLSLRF
jgi:hypothetical protein